MYAFVRLETLTDLADVIALLKRGATVGFEPVQGSLFGPTRPTKFKTVSGPPETLDEFVLRYLGDRSLSIEIEVPDGPEIEAIREMWRWLGPLSGTRIPPIALTQLVGKLADHLGGKIEPQMSYGAPGWVEWVKGGHGLLTLWFKPSPEELAEIAAYGARGVVNAVTARQKREWFEGVAGPYLMPNRGLIRYVEGMTPEAAWEASGEPSGLSVEWDRANQHYRLCGIVVPPDSTHEELKVPGRVARRYPKKAKLGPPPQDHPVRPVPIIPRDSAAHWIDAFWGEFVRVEFEG